jgi:23S rRNA (cytidine1920-2'-O)/16S rRNA (cytidine1409-2'-O)-methyltransferase
VVSLEATDARRLTRALIPASPDLIVTDVSFISLAKALPAALALAAPGVDRVALVKPQFEAGPARVGKGGLVIDAAVRATALAGVEAFVTAAGWTVRASTDSPIEGGDGNREFLLWASR